MSVLPTIPPDFGISNTGMKWAFVLMNHGWKLTDFEWTIMGNYYFFCFIIRPWELFLPDQTTAFSLWNFGCFFSSKEITNVDHDEVTNDQERIEGTVGYTLVPVTGITFNWVSEKKFRLKYNGFFN